MLQMEKMKEFKLPSLGEGIEKGTVIAIMVKVGDTISMEQSLMEVETDKVVVEVPSDTVGVVKEILINIGDEVNEGMAILRIDTESTEPSESLEVAPVANVVIEETKVASTSEEVKKGSSKKVEVARELKLPSLGEGIEKGTVISVLVSVGDTIVAEQSLLEVETDKVVVEVPSPEVGTVTEILINVGDEVAEGTSILKINTESNDDVSSVKEDEKYFIKEKEEEIIIAEKKVIGSDANQIMSSARKTKYRSSPLAKKMAREIGIDITNIQTDNPSKRISVQDVKNYAKELNQNRISGGNLHENIPLPDFTKWGETRNEAMSGIMQATSKNMTTSWSQIPHAWLQQKIDITYLEEKRQKHKGGFKAKGGALTITGILVNVVAKALEDFPIFNASIDQQNKSIIYKDFINIGVAVDTDRGLLVPVLKNSNKKSISDIAIELPSLAAKVKERKISAAELEGATFTISNLGGIGTSGIFPLVTFPQVAIMGVAASQTEAIYIDGQFQPRLIMPVTIGFDHRIINGADAARFLQHIKNMMEDWFVWNL